MKIKTELMEKMRSHARRSYPIEACGYLASKEGVVVELYEMENIDNSSEHFSFDKDEQIRAYLDSKSKGLTLSGVYHSHPYTPARPSTEDIELAYDKHFSYIIVSLAEEEIVIRSFKIVNKTVTQEQIEEI